MKRKKTSKLSILKTSTRTTTDPPDPIDPRIQRINDHTQAVLEHAAGGPLTFGGLLESIRFCDGPFTQTAFAKKLGIQRTHLIEIELGKRGVSPTRAARFGNTLGYGPDVFVRLAIEADLRRHKLELNFLVDTRNLATTSA